MQDTLLNNFKAGRRNYTIFQVGKVELYKYQAESERKRIIERQQQGIALAKQHNKYHGRKPQYAENDPRLQHAFKLYQAGMSDVDVARNTGIKRTTFIRYRKKFNVQR